MQIVLCGYTNFLTTWPILLFFYVTLILKILFFRAVPEFLLKIYKKVGEFLRAFTNLYKKLFHRS